MSRRIVVESEIYDAVLQSGGDDCEAYDFMALHTDNNTEVIAVEYDDVTHLFRLHGDVRTEWTDYDNCINILCALDNSLWNLPEIG